MRVRPIVWANAALALPAAISLYTGICNSLLRSQDLQWSGAHLVLHRIDPYNQFLRHDPEHRILLSQVPNYLHQLYILLLPLGALTFAHAKPIWALLNCFFALAITFLLRCIYGLSRSQTLLLVLLLFSNTPCRIVLGNGQQSLIELLFFCLIFYFAKPVGQGIALGLSYSKYSFSPVIFLYLFFRRQFRVLAVSFIPPLLGLIIMGLLVRVSPIALAAEPFAVSRSGVSAGLGDLMTILQTTLHTLLPDSLIGKLMYAAALLASGAYAFLLSRTGLLSPRRDAAALAVANLMFFTHLTYDYVFLAIPLAYALATPFRWVKIYILASIAFLWFGIKLIPDSLSSRAQLLEQCIVFFILSGILLLLSRNSPTFQRDPVESCLSNEVVEVA